MGRTDARPAGEGGGKPRALQDAGAMQKCVGAKSRSLPSVDFQPADSGGILTPDRRPGRMPDDPAAKLVALRERREPRRKQNAPRQAGRFVPRVRHMFVIAGITHLFREKAEQPSPYPEASAAQRPKTQQQKRDDHPVAAEKQIATENGHDER